MSDPRETWARLQQTLQSAQRRGRGGLGGGLPKNVFGGAAGAVLLIGGGLVLSNSLFNGEHSILLEIPG